MTYRSSWMRAICGICLARHLVFVWGFAARGPSVRIGAKSIVPLRSGMGGREGDPSMAKNASIAEDDWNLPSVECDSAVQLEIELGEEFATRKHKQGKQANSYWEVFSNAILDRVFVRRLDASSLRKNFLTKRYYAKNETFARSAFDSPPTVEDLLPYPTPIEDSFSLSVPAAILTFLVSCAIFPFLANFLVAFIDIPPENLEDINSKLVPGVSILYGTFMSLTLSILYNRQRQVQDSVAQETSLLSFLLYNLVSLFRRDRNRMVRAGQYAADQVRILLRENRGIEYMNLIYADPYIRMLQLVEEEEERLVMDHGDFLTKGVSVSFVLCRRES